MIYIVFRKCAVKVMKSWEINKKIDGSAARIMEMRSAYKLLVTKLWTEEVTRYRMEGNAEMNLKEIWFEDVAWILVS